MMGHFESHILPHISPYFNPLKKYLIAFRNVLLPKRFLSNRSKEAVHSLTTCRRVINVLKAALLDKKLIDEARQSHSVLGKRSVPGDLVVASNGWDVVKVPKTMLTEKPKLSPTTTRRTKLMTKRQTRK